MLELRHFLIYIIILCSPSTPTIRVRISSVFIPLKLLEKYENKQKRFREWPIFKIHYTAVFVAMNARSKRNVKTHMSKRTCHNAHGKVVGTAFFLMTMSCQKIFWSFDSAAKKSKKIRFVAYRKKILSEINFRKVHWTHFQKPFQNMFRNATSVNVLGYPWVLHG